jgi:UDP-4-amino-4,6-dideoxy-N-acetyl-beta-L-altrosamine N-acetyltransferase
MDHSLRILSTDDLPLLLQWRNHPSIAKFMFSQETIDVKAHYAWFQRVSEDPARHLLIYLTANTPKGFMQFSSIKGIKSIVEWGFYVAPTAEKGTGYHMCKLALDYAFNTMEVHKVFGEVLDFNIPSIKLHQKLGFIQEGLLRDHRFCGNKYVSVLNFGLLLEERNRILNENSPTRY